MSKRLQSVGNSSGVIIDESLLELLKITPDTELEVTTDGERLIITPIRTDAGRARAIERAHARTLKAHADTFRKLAQ